MPERRLTADNVDGLDNHQQKHQRLKIIPIVKNTIGLYTSQKTSKNYKYSKENIGRTYRFPLLCIRVSSHTHLQTQTFIWLWIIVHTWDQRHFTQEPWTTSGKTGLCFCRRLTWVILHSYTLLDTIALTKTCLQTCKQNKKKPHKVMLLWLLGGDFASLSLWLDGNNLYVINSTQSIFHSAVTSLDGYKDHFCLIQVWKYNGFTSKLTSYLKWQLRAWWYCLWRSFIVTRLVFLIKIF